MRNEYIATGKTIDDAINAGCAALGVDRDDLNVEIEVLETPTRSFLGLRTTDAKVKVAVVTEDEPEPADNDPSDKAGNFLAQLFRVMEMDVSIETEFIENDESANELAIELVGKDMGIVIGRRGDTLDALQYLTSLVVNRGEEDYVKVTVDTENYRRKREETLQRLAKKIAGKVVKYRRNMTLEPMNPFERRIIHSTLQDFEGVRTGSVGVEPNRKVVIYYEGPGGVQDERPMSGASRRGRRR